jgi:mRNA interferase MazF
MKRGQIRLVRFKQPDKPRPALILTRTEAVGQLNTVTVVPITSSIRDVRSQVLLDETDSMKYPCALNLDNIITVHQRLVGSFVAQLSDKRMHEVFQALKFAFGFEEV